jgi:hypothetical protein
LERIYRWVFCDYYLVNLINLFSAKIEQIFEEVSLSIQSENKTILVPGYRRRQSGKLHSSTSTCWSETLGSVYLHDRWSKVLMRWFQDAILLPIRLQSV